MVLAADISLAGTGFSTIPVFRGTFDGAGHTISGFAWLDKGSKVGLFRARGGGGFAKNTGTGWGGGGAPPARWGHPGR